MIRKEAEWAIRIVGMTLLVIAFYTLYSRPLTHSYHQAFLFIYLQLTLWVMLFMLLGLVMISFSSHRAKWSVGLLSLFLLAPYPWVHQTMSAQAEHYFFHQRQQTLQLLNQQILGASLNELNLYDQLADINIKGYEKGENYIAYRVDRMPEQRDGFVYLLYGGLPDRLFQYPVKHSKALEEKWFRFSSN